MRFRFIPQYVGHPSAKARGRYCGMWRETYGNGWCVGIALFGCAFALVHWVK